MKIGLSEILEKASKAKKTSEKIDILREHACPALYVALRYALDPAVKWGLPPGEPPYKPCEYIDGEGRFLNEVFKMYLFVDEGDDFMNLDQYKKISRHNLKLKKMKRELLFVSILESISPADARLLLAMKEKTLPFKNLTTKIIKEAFPGLIPDEPEVAATEEKVG